MQITLNGDPIDLPHGSTVADLAPGPGCAVAVNDTVVPGSSRRATVLRDGDRVEIVTAVQGG